MKPQNPPRYDRAAIERRARRLVRTRLGPAITPPIDVEFLLDEDAILDVYPGLRANHRVEGCICREEVSGNLYVYVDCGIADTSPNHYRMVVAEELGHLHLHRDLIDGIETPKELVEVTGHPEWNAAEGEAKRFGLAVLMPENLLKTAAEEIYPTLVDAAGFGDANAIEKYFKMRLAVRFEVRPADINRRLSRWPINLCERMRRSVREQSDLLLPDTWSDERQPSQKTFGFVPREE